MVGTPRRQSARLHAHTPQRNPPSLVKLSTLVERETTPENERLNLAVAASAPAKVNTGIPKPIQWSTPSSRNLLKPDHDEMHPGHAQSIEKKLAFQKRVGTISPTAYAGTPKKDSVHNEQDEAAPINPFSSPTFEFKFKRPSTELSSEAQKLMNELRGNAARYKTELATTQEHEEEDSHMTDGRKIAMPKGKMGRYSDVHMKDFKKMHSIANHASAFRAEQARVPATAKNLKRSNSKAGLDQPDTAVRRTPSTKSLMKEDSDEIIESPAKRFKPYNAHGLKVKLTLNQDRLSTPAVQTALDRPKSGIPTPPAFGTPTKASLARSASTKSLAAGPSKIPSIAKSPSFPAFTTPQPVRVAQVSNQTTRNVRTSFVDKIKNVKSILRRPQLRFSDDPLKLAAGTHVATPKTDESKALPSVPEAPSETPEHRAEKHVNFSPDPDTMFRLSRRASSPAQPPTPSPAKPSHAPLSLDGTMMYPALPHDSPCTAPKGPADFTFRSDKTISFSPKQTTPTIRRVRASDTSALVPQIQFKSGATTPSKLFAAAPARSSDFPTVPHGISNKKRKREFEDVGSKDDDKENIEEDAEALEEEPTESPKKKARVMTTAERKPAVKKPVGKLTKPSTAAASAKGANGAKKGFLSLSRLNALARPKNRG